MPKKINFLICGLVALLGLSACSSGTTDNKPDDGGTNPPSGDTKYQVSQEYWTSNITQAGFFGINHNLTMNLTMTGNDGNIERGSLANQNGKLHIDFEAEGEKTELYVDTLTDGTYDLYFQNEDNKWEKSHLPASYLTTLSESFVSFINPWLFTDFTYNDSTHAYEKASDTIKYGDTTVSLSDIAIKFEDSKLLSITYKASEGGVSYDSVLNVTKWGSTVVSFPSIDVNPPVVNPTSITLSETEIQMKVGDNKELVATVLPENADNKVVTWASSNSSIALVERTGSDTSKINIKAEGEGEATITATVGDNITATCKVIVEKGQSDAPIPAESISVSQTSLEMKVGESVKLIATVLPENATNKLVHWSPDQKGVVNIETSGENDFECTVTAIGVGSCNLTAIVRLGVEVVIPITVTSSGEEPPVVYPTNIVLSKTAIDMKVGETVTVTATVLPENATIKNVRWTYNEEKLEVTLVDGDSNKINVKALKEGEVALEAFLLGGEVKARCVVNISAAAVINPTSISLSSTTLSMKEGETAALTATVLPENATNKAVRWSTSNAEIVSVTPNAADSSKASIKAEGEGRSTITAITGNGLVATCVIEVSKDVVPLTPDNMMGITLKYKAFAGPTNYGEEALTNEQVDMIMGDVVLALFAGTAGEDGEISGCEFEYYHETSPMQGAYFGSYTIGEGYDWATGSVDRFYNFTTEKFAFGNGISYRNIVCNYGNLNIIYINESNVDSFQVEGYTISVGMYILSGYLMDSNGNVSGKGYALFEKVNDNPTHLANVPENHEEPDISGIANDKLFVYESYVSSDTSFIGNAAYHQEQENAYFALFDDGTFEYHVYYNYSGTNAYEDERIYRGSFTVDYTSDEEPIYGEDVYSLTLSAKDVVKNDEVTPLRFVYFDLYYSVSENAIYRVIDDAYAYSGDDGSRVYAVITQKFALSSDKPQKYQTPTYDNWDADAVSEALGACGYSDTLPKLDGVKTFSIRDANVDSFIIYCAFPDNDLAVQASEDYNAVVDQTFTPLTQYNPETGSEVNYHFSPNGQYKVEWHASLNYVYITVVNAVTKYPTADINNYLTVCSYTDELPSLAVAGASGYIFSSGSLYIYIGADKVEESKTYIANLLIENGYKARSYNGRTYYLSINKQMALSFIEEANGFGITIYSGETFPESEFPTDKLAEYLTGVTDTYPDLSYSGDAVYSYEGPSGNYLDGYVTVGFSQYLTEDEYLNVFVPSLKNALLEAGYVHYNSITVVSSSGVTRTYNDIYISPNGQISIRLPSVKASYDYDESGAAIVVYKGYAISFVNLVTNRVTESDDGLPHLDSIYVGDYTFNYLVGSTFTFDGTVYANYTNGGATKEITPTSISTPDMSTAGYQIITITYTEDGVTKECTININVYEPELLEYVYQNEDTFDIFADGAEFKVWAWGGQYGRGQWVEISSINQESKEFVIDLYEDCEGFQIVRLNPNDMPADVNVWGVTAWNQTGTLTLSYWDYYFTFAFVNNGGGN